MMTPPSQQPQTTTDTAREIQATLAARREMGAEYDDHFIQALAERLTAQARQEVARAQPAKPPRRGLSSEQRTGIAICSLIFGIPLIAISLGAGGGLYFGAIILLLLGINFLAAW